MACCAHVHCAHAAERRSSTTGVAWRQAATHRTFARLYCGCMYLTQTCQLVSTQLRTQVWTHPRNERTKGMGQSASPHLGCVAPAHVERNLRQQLRYDQRQPQDWHPPHQNLRQQLRYDQRQPQDWHPPHQNLRQQLRYDLRQPQDWHPPHQNLRQQLRYQLQQPRRHHCCRSGQ
jgi:hypothetical protein